MEPLHKRLDREAADWWDDRDVNRLLAHYTPYADQLADQRASRQRLVDPDEYRQEALIGLWECIESFDAEAGASFTTWAWCRIQGRLVEAERANDWVKPKVRASARDGELDLPAMLRIKETFDTAIAEQDTATQELLDTLACLLASAKPWAVNYIGCYLDAGGNVDAAAALLGVTAEYFGQVLLPQAIGELRGIPCRT